VETLRPRNMFCCTTRTARCIKCHWYLTEKSICASVSPWTNDSSAGIKVANFYIRQKVHTLVSLRMTHPLELRTRDAVVRNVNVCI
jgi:hypothetical protein